LAAQRTCCIAVIRFARETGDIHVLSKVDIKLLALAHTLELIAHGSSHIQEHPGKVGTMKAVQDLVLKLQEQLQQSFMPLSGQGEGQV
jgi:hypothetical protein